MMRLLTGDALAVLKTLASDGRQQIDNTPRKQQPNMPQLKQIQSTIANLIVIAIVVAAGAVSTAGLGGGIHNFPEFLNALEHGLLAGGLVSLGWLGMKSPLAGQVRTLLGTETVTEPSGKTTETTIQVTEPAKVDQTKDAPKP